MEHVARTDVREVNEFWTKFGSSFYIQLVANISRTSSSSIAWSSLAARFGFQGLLRLTVLTLYGFSLMRILSYRDHSDNLVSLNPGGVDSIKTARAFSEPSIERDFRRPPHGKQNRGEIGSNSFLPTRLFQSMTWFITGCSGGATPLPLEFCSLTRVRSGLWTRSR